MPLKTPLNFILLTAALLLIAVLALCCGSTPETAAELRGLFSGGTLSGASRIVLLEIRLPRIIGAAAAGILLASAGCAVQLIFRNPLSSPHVLGSVNASALGAVAVMALGGVSLASLLAGGFAGAVLVLGVLLLITCRRDTVTLLLAGIALNAFASAAMSGILFVAGERLEGLVFWLLGGFWRLDWLQCAVLLGICVPVLSILYIFRREMNMLYLGENAAATAGVNTRRVVFFAVLSVTLATAAVVSCCGVIGFVGLLVPHMARRIFGGEFAASLTGSALLGACLMILSDLIGRMLVPPLEIPVGVLTALIGAPFFLMLILGKMRGYGVR